jgi:fluoride ion exporter CrcB/FEX
MLLLIFFLSVQQILTFVHMQKQNKPVVVVGILGKFSTFVFISTDGAKLCLFYSELQWLNTNDIK